MIRMGICWCKPGMMSQCTAPDIHAQELCDYFNNSLGSRKCMHLCENIDNHCDCQKAQDFARAHGVRTPDDISVPETEEFELRIDDFIEPEKRCDKCILYACSYVIHENHQAAGRGGLTMEDLEKIANKCPDYDDEKSMQQKINQSLRGNNP